MTLQEELDVLQQQMKKLQQASDLLDEVYLFFENNNIDMTNAYDHYRLEEMAEEIRTEEYMLEDEIEQIIEDMTP